MKTRVAIAAALLSGALASPLLAGPVIDWDPAFFYEPGVTFNNSIPGNQMTVVGIISAFGPPLSFLNANDPSKDYTFYLSGMVSNGTTTIGAPGSQFYVTTYTGGTIQVLEGTPRDAVFDPNPPNANVPSTFVNGTVLLSGIVSGFYTQTNDFTTFDTGNAEANITWTGGTLLSYLSNQDGPCPALFTGGITWYPQLSIPGYVFRQTGKIDNDCPSPTKTSTWGRVKSLYR